MKLDHYLGFDVETYSEVNLKECGAYAYAIHPSTEVLCMSYSFAGDSRVLRWRQGQQPPHVFCSAWKEGLVYHAWNVQFDSAIWYYILHKRYGWPFPGNGSFEEGIKYFNDDAVVAAFNGLTLKLETSSAAVGRSVKDTEGHALMMKLCKPAKAIKADKNPKRLHTEENLNRLYAYCDQDVLSERATIEMLRPLDEFELKLRAVDQAMNHRGILCDVGFAQTALNLAAKHKERFDKEVRELTNGQVKSAATHQQLTPWLQADGLDIPSVGKDVVREYLERDDLTPLQRRLLELRQQISKSSISKYKRMLYMNEVAGPRLRGMHALWGARTGRWAGRLVQPQNLPRGLGFDDHEVRQLIAQGDYELLDMWYGPEVLMELLSQAVRYAFIPAPGKEFVCSDFSSIEGRVLAWLAGEEKILQAYREGKDMYKVNAVDIYGVSYDDVTKDQRQIGKVAELALGYQGGPGAFNSMGKNYGIVLPEEEADKIKCQWRAGRENTCRFWWDCQEAAIWAWNNPNNPIHVGPQKVTFKRIGRNLYVRLPSGRWMTYRDGAVKWKDAPWDREAAIEEGRACKQIQQFSYMGLDSYTNRWKRITIYGGMWAENITQAVARDLMATAMIRAHNRGWNPVLTVHDELLFEQHIGEVSLDDLNMLMTKPVSWAKGCPVSADGWVGSFYRK